MAPGGSPHRGPGDPISGVAGLYADAISDGKGSAGKTDFGAYRNPSASR